jgi:hypothetical protein
MRLVVVLVVFVLAMLVGNCSAQAQVLIPGTNLTVTPVNGGTGSLVSIPIPGDSGLSITVGHGSAALPLQNIHNMTDSTLVQLGDDGWRNVPLPFQFPYWGQVFDQSTMYSNGVVQFGRPVPTNGWPSWNNAFCCHGADLTTNTNTGHNYSIMPLWTDLVDYSGQTTYYRGTPSSMTYGWYNTSQYGQRNNRNTFELQINNTGTFDVRYGGTYIAPTNGVTIGMTGDLSKGEYVQYYNGMGFQGPTAGFSWSALNGTGAVDQCIINPLSSPSCSGYQAAYTVQQCAISSLFDPTCPGYQNAYFNYQCSLTALYNRNCPGYVNAYHDQQCYANALYATDCPGYASAYLQQQCTANPLYSTTCDGYAVAYHDQQCSFNPLFMSDCIGYAAAYKAQQCALDGLYDRTCPNYSTAYATRMLLEQQNMASTVATAGVIAQTAPSVTSTTSSTTSASTTISNDGTVSTGVSRTGDTNVDRAIATPAPTANSAAAPAAAVQLAPPSPAPQQQMAQNEPRGGGNKQEDKKDDAPKGSGGNSAPQNTNTTQASSDKPAAPTARQALQERREAAAKAEAVEKGKNLAGEMGKASDLEAQKAVQNVVISAMGFTPGFDAYSRQMIVQQQFYPPYQVYGNQKTIDNRANLRMFGGTDRLHNEMVEKQYERK